MIRAKSADQDWGLRAAVTLGLGSTWFGLIVLSCVSNILMLTGPLFMMQVYDRVLVSASIPTLVVLTVIVAVLFVFYGVIESLRTRIVTRVGNVFDERVRGAAFRAGLRMRLTGHPPRSDPLQDVESVRGFTGSPAVLAFLDLPWTPIYVAVVFVVHPALGWLAVAGLIVVTSLLVINELITRRAGGRADEVDQYRRRQAAEASESAEAAEAMGMTGTLERHWSETTVQSRVEQTTFADRSGGVSSSSKSIRFFLQSAVLAVAAYVVIQGELSPGAMIAASVITARALAPVDQVVGSWKSFAGARRSWDRLNETLPLGVLVERRTSLPTPTSSLVVANMAARAPLSRDVIVGGLEFSLGAGDAMAVIGPSGAGKSSIVRTLLGIWEPASGDVRLDGAELQHHDLDLRGSFIGYLPQRVELLRGTVAQNISRFVDEPDSMDVMAAAELAGVHELISQLPDGYDTEIGSQGSFLSAGQRQRIALARAAYGKPFLIVLDEPNANLDSDGDAALAAAVMTLRASGSIVIMVSHRPSAVATMSHVLVVGAGRQQAFGPKDEILHPASQVVRT